MTPQLLAALEANRSDLARQCEIAGIDADGLEDFIAHEMARNGADWAVGIELLAMCCNIPDRRAKLRTLSRLLLTPAHHQHQAVTMEMQQMADPASIDAIRATLDKGFGDFAYTCSDDNVIAKWFGHALWKIGTPEAIALIREHARSPNPLVAEEMRYRLERIAEDTPDLLVPAGSTA
jgi:hypothetical protein